MCRNGFPKNSFRKNRIIFVFVLRFFASGEETRQKRRIHRAELKEIGRLEAIKRGKTVKENGKAVKNT